MRIFASQSAAGHAARRAVLAALLVVSAGAAAAKDSHSDKQPANADQYYGLDSSGTGAPAVSRLDRANFDHSGTRGREGLGESPFHPEGPGNVAD